MGTFYGLPTGELANRHLALEYLREAGPRIVRVALAGSTENLLAELPEVSIPTPSGGYAMRGGHRLWHAPEALPRSYVQDNEGLTIDPLADGVRLIQPVEALTGIRKRLTIRLADDRPAVTVDHHLTNEGVWPVELAPWGITQLPLGGVGILPQPTGPLDPAGLLPNRQLVLWPYTRWEDPRLSLADPCLLMEAKPLLPPCKVGYLNRHGWVAYLRAGVLFVKRFDPRAAEPHPDYGCNAEFYCNDTFIEMESLGVLTRLEPGQSVDHREVWEFARYPDVPATFAGAQSIFSRIERETRPVGEPSS